MELEEAASRLQTLANFYDGLKYLQEIVATARTVDNIKVLAAERQALADKARLDLETAQRDLSNFQLQAAAARKDAIQQQVALADQFRQKQTDLETDFKAKHDANLAALDTIQVNLVDAQANYNRTLADLEATRAALQGKIDALNAELESLKARFGAL